MSLSKIINGFGEDFAFDILVNQIDEPQTLALLSKEYLVKVHQMFGQKLLAAYESYPRLKQVVEQVRQDIQTVPERWMQNDFTLDYMRAKEVYKRIILEAKRYCLNAISSSIAIVSKRNPVRLDALAAEIESEKRTLSASCFLHFFTSLCNQKPNIKSQFVSDCSNISLEDITDIVTRSEEIRLWMQKHRALLSAGIFELNLEFDRISSQNAPIVLPEEISLLSSLTDLKLKGFFSLPFPGPLPNLEKLVIELDDHLLSSEQFFSSLSILTPKLKTLEQNCLKMTTLPQNIKLLSHLEVLKLPFHSLTSFPHQVFTLPALQKLNLVPALNIFYFETLIPFTEMPSKILACTNTPKRFVFKFSVFKDVEIDIELRKDRLITRKRIQEILSIYNDREMSTFLDLLARCSMAVCLGFLFVLNIAELVFGYLMGGLALFLFEKYRPSSSNFDLRVKSSKVFDDGLGMASTAFSETFLVIPALFFQVVYKDKLDLEKVESQIAKIPLVGSPLKALYISRAVLKNFL